MEKKKNIYIMIDICKDDAHYPNKKELIGHFFHIKPKRKRFHKRKDGWQAVHVKFLEEFISQQTFVACKFEKFNIDSDIELIRKFAILRLKGTINWR